LAADAPRFKTEQFLNEFVPQSSKQHSENPYTCSSRNETRDATLSKVAKQGARRQTHVQSGQELKRDQTKSLQAKLI